MAKAALRADKHVLVEKPLATNLREGRELVALARRSPGLLMCAPFTVLSPTFRIIGERLRRGDIGRVVSARGRYGWAGPDWTDWFYKPGGGALFDLGVYLITTLTGWLGPVRRVSAMAGIAIRERVVRRRRIRVEAEDNMQILLDFGGNCFASLTTGFTIQQYQARASNCSARKARLICLATIGTPTATNCGRIPPGAGSVSKRYSLIGPGPTGYGTSSNASARASRLWCALSMLATSWR